MSDEHAGRGGGAPGGLGLEDYLGFARAHGQTSDTRQWITDLEELLRVAWDLMTPGQRAAFRQHPDVLGIVEAAGGSSA